MIIQPQLLSLNQLLKERLFRIPEYQRSYSWKSKHRADLFSDIEKVAASGEPHFMATIVGLRRGIKTIITNEFHDVEIVDGQQRITTLVLLLKAIELALDRSVNTENLVAQELRQLLVKDDKLAPVLLQTNHDASQHCITYLRQGTHAAPKSAKTDADECLLTAMTEAEAFVAKWETKGRLLELVAILKNKLTFIFYELNSEAVVYTVFEVLNSRGLDVSWFDRLKSILMGLAFESKTGNEKDTIAELHRRWRDIYNVIGLRPRLSAETLRVAATLWSSASLSRPLGEEEAVATLRDIARNSAKGVIDVTSWLYCVVCAMDQVHADRRRESVTRIAQTRLLAAAIRTRNDISNEDCDRLLGLWERVSFRIYGISGKDARTKVGDYVRLAQGIVKDRLNVSEIEKGLVKIGAAFPINNVVESLRDSNCYTDWQQDLRYVLFHYEEHLAKQAGQRFDNAQWSRIWEADASESIEHIQPQSKGADQPSDQGIFVHRLGNLMLLPPRLNSQLQDRPPVKKKDEYIKTGLHQAIDVANRIPTWDRTAVIKREKEIIAWATSYWAD